MGPATMSTLLKISQPAELNAGIVRVCKPHFMRIISVFLKVRLHVYELSLVAKKDQGSVSQTLLRGIKNI